MKHFIKEMTAKENWKKAWDLLGYKDPSLSGQFKKQERIPSLLSILIALILVALLSIIIGTIKYYIKLGAS